MKGQETRERTNESDIEKTERKKGKKKFADSMILSDYWLSSNNKCGKINNFSQKYLPNSPKRKKERNQQHIAH